MGILRRRKNEKEQLESFELNLLNECLRRDRKRRQDYIR